MVTQEKEHEMAGPRKHGEFPFRDTFNRLGAIAGRGAARTRLAHLLRRQENLRAQGKRPSPDECLDLGLAQVTLFHRLNRLGGRAKAVLGKKS
jgi:hypothetical protein